MFRRIARALASPTALTAYAVVIMMAYTAFQAWYLTHHAQTVIVRIYLHTGPLGDVWWS